MRSSLRSRNAVVVAAAVVLTAAIGGGAAIAGAIRDDDSFYEVEVTLANGDQVDVQLDRAFKVLGSEIEGPTGDS